LIGIASLALALLFFNLHFRGNSPDHSMFLIGMWITIIFGGIMTFLGLGNILDARCFNARVQQLQNGGSVSRGSITAVRHRWILFGSTLGTRGGRYTMVMDTGWYYRVSYTFEDELGRLRKCTGLIPDLVGPKRHGDRNQQIIHDQNLPRIGQRVDVLFNPDESVILRIVDAT